MVTGVIESVDQGSWHTVHCVPALAFLALFGDVGGLCTLGNVQAAAAAGIARSSQLMQPLARTTGGTQPFHHSTNHRLSSTLLQLGRAGHFIASVPYGLRPLWW